MKCLLRAALLCSLLFSQVWALESVDGLPVHLKADQLHYLDTDQKVMATGHAHFEFQDMIVEADALMLDLLSNQVSGHGEVQIVRGGVPIQCGSFRYDIEGGQLEIGKFVATITDESFVGVADFTADSLQSSANMYWGSQARFTTCDYLRPHYYLSADSFEYYVNSRIEAHGVWFIENDLPLGLALPLFYSPFYVYYMDHRQVVYLFPDIGSNQTFGWYIKNTFDYYYDTGFYGLLTLDYFQKKGWGLGVDHHYTLGDDQSGRAKIYNFDERDTTGAYNRDYLFHHEYKPNDRMTLSADAAWLAAICFSLLAS